MAILRDPPEPPEGGSNMRAADLVNKVCVFRPTDMGEWPAKPAVHDEAGNVVDQAKKAQPYVECDVWVLDRAGIVEEGTGVRVSWWKAVEQLKDGIGEFTAAKPKQEDGGKAIFLQALSGEARDVAAKVVESLLPAQPVPASEEWSELDGRDGDEPF